MNPGSALLREGDESKFCIKYSPAFGRHLVADRDLDSHELIMDEKPLVVAPSGYFDIDPDTQRPLLICIGCLRSQNIGESALSFTKCPCCSWPICGATCDGIAKFHTDAECLLFQRNGICQSPRYLRMVYLIRCCLMSIHDQENWRKLLQLADSVDGTETDQGQDNDEQKKSDDDRSMTKQDLIDYKFLTEVCQLRIHKELVIKINGVKKVNGFRFANCDYDDVRYYGIALYFMASMASHGCTPNLSTQVSYDPLGGFPMRFRTKTRVVQGQVLQIAYRTHWLTLGTLRRREKIFLDHHFWCVCSRCTDPEENSSQFSAVICPDCHVGSLLPLNPLNNSDLWKCKNKECEQVKDEKVISDILETINNNIERVLELNACSLTKFEQLSQILRENSLLHNNHYLIMRAKVEWIIHFPFQLLHNAEEAWDLFTLLIERAEHCKAVYCKIIADWLEKNCFVEIVIGKAYLLYYLTPNDSDGSSLPLHDDLQLDLMKTSLKHLQSGLRYAEPFSEIACVAKASCKSLKSRIQHLMKDNDKLKATDKHCNECD